MKKFIPFNVFLFSFLLILITFGIVDEAGMVLAVNLFLLMTIIGLNACSFLVSDSFEKNKSWQCFFLMIIPLAIIIFSLFHEKNKFEILLIWGIICLAANIITAMRFYKENVKNSP